MMRLGYLMLCLTAVLCFAAVPMAEGGNLLTDDFEGPISGGVDGTVDFGSGNGSSVNVTGSTDIKHSGNQAMKIEYEAVPGGYMWIARGYDLDVKGAACWQQAPQDINWEGYNAISFYMYGSDSGGLIAFDIKDYGNEMWRFIIDDDFAGWKQIVLPFPRFLSRSDWQPANADKNDILDFPIKSFQFEPLPPSKGVLYFDSVELVWAE